MLGYFPPQLQEAVQKQKKEENADPLQALNGYLALLGKDLVQEDGSLSFDNVCAITAICKRQQCRYLKEERVKHNESKAACAKDLRILQNQMNLQKMTIGWQQKTIQVFKIMTVKASSFLEIEESVIHNSLSKYVKESEEMKAKICSIDRAGWIEMAMEGEMKEEEVYLKALKRNQQLVYECDKKCLALQQYVPSTKVQYFVNYEKDIANSKLYEEFQIDNAELEAAIEKFQLLKSKDIENFTKLVNTQRQMDGDKRRAEVTLPAEKMQSLIKEIDLLGKPQMKSDGTMTFEYFLESSKIIEKYVSEFLVEHRARYVDQRRQLTKESLKDGEIAFDLGRDNSIREHFAFENDAKLVCVGAVYSHAGITEESYLKTTACYLCVPEEQKKKDFFTQEIEKIQQKYRKTACKEMTKEEVLVYYQAEQEAKFDAQIFIHQSMNNSKMDQEEMRYIVKEKELLENDKLFLKFGVEMADIQPNMERLGMDEKDEELNKIKANFNAKKQDYKLTTSIRQEAQMAEEKAQLENLKANVAAQEDRVKTANEQVENIFTMEK